MNVTHHAPLPLQYQKLVIEMQSRYGTERANEILNEMASVYETIAGIARRDNTSVEAIRQETAFMFDNLRAIARRGNGISEVQTSILGNIQEVSDPISLTSQESVRRKARSTGRFFIRFTRSQPLPS